MKKYFQIIMLLFSVTAYTAEKQAIVFGNGAFKLVTKRAPVPETEESSDDDVVAKQVTGEMFCGYRNIMRNLIAAKKLEPGSHELTEYTKHTLETVEDLTLFDKDSEGLKSPDSDDLYVSATPDSVTYVPETPEPV